jgi:transcriptional regulator with XRE-family HTH domain
MSNPVREVREKLKLSQPAMALKLGCGVTTLRGYEYASTVPTGRSIYNNLSKQAAKAGVVIPPRPEKRPPIPSKKPKEKER